MSFDLAPVRATFEALGGLEIPMVHLAGSKGKGTTATLLAKIIQLNGDTVGLFTSPFIEEEFEMVSVNGVMISREDYSRLQEKVLALNAGLSTFEVQTLAAYEYFKEQNCDIVVVECGLGGLTDATNVANLKALTLLTHIELEHQDFLGDTLEEITQQKLGICRAGVPLMTVATQDAVVIKTIEKLGFSAQVAPAYALAYHHPESMGLAIAAAEFLGYAFDSVVQKVLAELVIPGRFEVMKYGPHTLLLDGAHTYDSVQYVLGRLPEFAQAHSLPEVQFCIHFLKDKNPDLWKLFPRDRTLWIALNDERAGEKPEELLGSSMDVLWYYLRDLETPQFIVFIGSFRLLTAVKKVLK